MESHRTISRGHLHYSHRVSECLRRGTAPAGSSGCHEHFRSSSVCHYTINGDVVAAGGACPQRRHYDHTMRSDVGVAQSPVWSPDSQYLIISDMITYNRGNLVLVDMKSRHAVHVTHGYWKATRDVSY